MITTKLVISIIKNPIISKNHKQNCLIITTFNSSTNHNRDVNPNRIKFFGKAEKKYL